jgi:hypothetical protein
MEKAMQKIASRPPMLYPRREAARLLGSSITMLKRLERTGRLHPVRLGSKNVFYRADEIEALARGDTAMSPGMSNMEGRPK